MSNLGTFAKEYNSIWGIDGAIIGTPAKPVIELTKEEQLKRIEDFIKEYNVETDDRYIYLYKATNMDGKDNSNDFVYAIGKTFVVELNTNINNERAKGVYVNTFDDALKLYKYINLSWGKVVNWSFDIPKNPPTNPSILNEKTFRIFKVKINKSDVIITKNNNIRVGQLEVIDEVSLEPKLNYSVESITEIDNGFRFNFNIENTITGKFINVDFVSKDINISQDVIKATIQARIVIMQGIYDKFAESNGDL